MENALPDGDSNRQAKPSPVRRAERHSGAVPPGAPSWVTPEQPYYAEPLTVVDALDMVLNVANLGALLKEGIDEQ